MTNGHTRGRGEKPASIASSWLPSTASSISLSLLVYIPARDQSRAYAVAGYSGKHLYLYAAVLALFCNYTAKVLAGG